MQQETESSAVIDTLQRSGCLSCVTDMCAMLLLLPFPMKPAYSATRWRQPETATCRLHKCGGGAQGMAMGIAQTRQRLDCMTDRTDCKNIT